MLIKMNSKFTIDVSKTVNESQCDTTKIETHEYECSLKIKIPENVFNYLNNEFKDSKHEVVLYSNKKRIVSSGSQVKVKLKDECFTRYIKEMVLPFTITESVESDVYLSSLLYVVDTVKTRIILYENKMAPALNEVLSLRISLEIEHDVHGETLYFSAEIESTKPILSNMERFMVRSEIFMNTIASFVKIF